MAREMRCELLPAPLIRTEMERAAWLERWATVTARQAQQAEDQYAAEMIIDRAYQLDLVAQELRREARQ